MASCCDRLILKDDSVHPARRNDVHIIHKFAAREMRVEIWRWLLCALAVHRTWLNSLATLGNRRNLSLEGGDSAWDGQKTETHAHNAGRARPAFTGSLWDPDMRVAMTADTRCAQWRWNMEEWNKVVQVAWTCRESSECHTEAGGMLQPGRGQNNWWDHTWRLN